MGKTLGRDTGPCRAPEAALGRYLALSMLSNTRLRLRVAAALSRVSDWLHVSNEGKRCVRCAWLWGSGMGWGCRLETGLVQWRCSSQAEPLGVESDRTTLRLAMWKKLYSNSGLILLAILGAGIWFSNLYPLYPAKPKPFSDYDNVPPVTATAICADQTLSYSQTRRWACSRHGGVAQWLR